MLTINVMKRVMVHWRKKSKLAFVAIFVVSLMSTTPASAGIPVIDIASVIQSILSVLNEITSIENQISQIEHQVDHYKAIVGNHNLGQILDDPSLHNYIPEDAASQFDQLSQGYNGLSSEAKQMRDASMIYNCQNMSGQQQAQCQGMFGRPYEQKAQLEDALKAANGRLQQIESLMEQINSTDDPAAKQEINARISAEIAQIENEKSRTQLMMGIYDAQHQADEQRSEELRMNRASQTGSVTSQVHL